VVLVEAPNHVDGLQPETELPSEAHHLVLVPTDRAALRRKELRKEESDPARDLVHVVIEIGLVREVGPPRHPSGHPECGVTGVTDDHVPCPRGELAQGCMDLGHVARRLGVRKRVVGVPQVDLDGRQGSLPVEHRVPLLQQLDLSLRRHGAVVLDVVGDTENQVGHLHLFAERLREALDANGEGAGGGA
jgi:hypothetical protein